MDIVRIRANFAGSTNDATATDFEMWAAGSDIVNWGNENPGILTVKLDKTKYKVGDTATALIESPYPTGRLYFSVVRFKPIYQQMLQVSGGAPRVRFTVTADMLPNAAVQAVLVRTGTPLSVSVPDNLDSLSRTGFAPLNVALDDRRLKLTIAPAQPKLEPGQMQTVALQMRDASGAIAACEDLLSRVPPLQRPARACAQTFSRSPTIKVRCARTRRAREASRSSCPTTSRRGACSQSR